MKRKAFLFSFISIFAFISIFLLFNSTVAKKAEKDITFGAGEVYEALKLGIKDPEGHKAIWVMSPYGAKNMKAMLAPYSSEEIEGVYFFNMSSWKDTSKAYKIAYEDRDRMIWKNYTEISTLKKRVEELEDKLSELKK